MNEPLVSLIVCCYNEEKYIEKCLISLLNQENILGEFEILVIDGMSNDRTRSIVKNFLQLDSRIKMLDNPAKVKPPAVNLGFRASKGKYIAICDAHTLYDKNYFSNSISIIESHPEAWCVGGPIISIGESNFGRANALAMSSPIGVGNAKHRFSEYEGYAEMACFPLFRREVLDWVGYYDEFFDINHDDEYCFRLRKAGGKVFLSPIAKSYYYVRNSIKGLFRQYFSYGYWQIAFLKKHKIPISIRQLIPFLFFSVIIILLFISIILKKFWLGLLLPLVYVSILVLSSIPILFKKEIRVAINFPIAVFILHFSYALGFFFGLFRFSVNDFKRNE
ncbi:MAG: glycosyltransferase family 2 protein [Ignavibacteriota bacterium]|nr:glycosyltransferase family 2 protein [Ignavibacteriota bacterium]MCO6448166.1 glycosyltransferase family 2 protein [Ignavibacterium album]MCZ2267331.1 glycosyltransferase family 2 protein [Ignavibacteriales bacterium]QKJ99471.1 MAG: glycosyltransferase family 2 protein [Ignavibacteriota bacterium]HOJ06877.1 glycosyltransferase family 2 protein [Ignavibacteriaceae bacterium]